MMVMPLPDTQCWHRVSRTGQGFAVDEIGPCAVLIFPSTDSAAILREAYLGDYGVGLVQMSASSKMQKCS